jgi:DNA-binding response OmpR family regulator
MEEGGRRILFVDDDANITAMLARALSRHGFQVDATTSSDEALALCGTRTYDAALVDLVMPGLDGANLAEALRLRIPGLPIGLLTGYTHSPLIGAAERAGSRLFKKPVEIQELIEFLKTEIH